MDPESAAEGTEESKPQAEKLSPQERAWLDQQALLTKFRIIADDARTYEQDTGVHVLNLGFPLLSLPPGTFSSVVGGSKCQPESAGADCIRAGGGGAGRRSRADGATRLPRRGAGPGGSERRAAGVDRAADGQAGARTVC